jgi:hypothetical protein
MKHRSVGLSDKPWDVIDYNAAANLYAHRYGIHKRLIQFLQGNQVYEYVQLALGIVEKGGNYSAAEHGLGPKILQHSSPETVFELAKKLFTFQGSPEKVPEVIYKENIPYLKISVGSEMGALLRPQVLWVTNVRTVWAHLVIKHNDLGLANEELRYYRTTDMPSEMEYQLWSDIHPQVGSNMHQIVRVASMHVNRQGIKAGDLTYLWADAIADTAYNKYSKL